MIIGGTTLGYEAPFVLLGASTNLTGSQVSLLLDPPAPYVGAYTGPATSVPITGPPFFAAELSVAKTGASLSISYAQGYDSHPISALAETTDPALTATSAILVSDAGYRTAPTDTGIAGSLTGVQCYWPSLSTAFQITRAVNLDPSTSGVAASWGSLSLINYQNQWDHTASAWNADNRPVKIYYGTRTLENFAEWRGTRASVGTYIDVNGNMQSAPINQVRWDYSTGSAALLSEQAATNQVPNTTTAPNHNGSTTLTVSTDVPYLREGEPIFKATYVPGGGGEYLSYRGPSPNLIAFNSSITGSVYVWVPVTVNPTSNFIFNYETTGLGKSINIDTTRTGKWVRYSLTITNGQGRNLIDHCTDYSSTYWSFPSGGGSLATDTTAAYDGAVTADTLTKSGTAEGVLRRTITIPADTATYTFSVLLKAGTSGYASLGITFGSYTSFPLVVYRFSDGAISARSGTDTPVNYGVTTYANGYRRVFVTASNVGQTSAILDIRVNGDATASLGATTDSGTLIVGGGQFEVASSPSAFDVNGTGTGNFCIKDASPFNSGDVIYTTCWQIETGTTATSFIHTYGSGATRAQDFNYPSRQLWLDPSYSTLKLAFAGVATPWRLSDVSLDIPIRDATYWLERPVNSTQYGGTGGNDGAAVMAGVPKPMLRGIVYNITPTLIDAVNRLYQYNNAPGSIQALYEGGAQTITFQSDVADLTVGSTTAGQYRTCNAMGMFQLGSNPIHPITIDATGSFTTAGSQTNIANIARYLMTEDMLIPSANINLTSFSTAATGYPYPAGIFIDSTQNLNGVDVLDTLLESLAAKLIINRTGQVVMFVLRAIPANTNPVGTFDTTNIVNLTPKPLPSTLVPPPYRWRVGYGFNWTVQTSDLNTASIVAAHKLYVSTANQYATAASTTVLANFARPNDHVPIGGALTTLANAQTVANDLIALWSTATARTLYTITLPISVALNRDIGDVVRVNYPAITSLATGALGQIVAEVFNSLDTSVSFDVLI